MERTEAPTKKKLRDARKKGEAPYSPELTSALLLVVFFTSLLLFSKPLQNAFKSLFLLKPSCRSVYLPLLGIFFLLLLVCLSSHFLQKGFLFSFKKKEKIKERPLFYNFILLIIKILLLAFLTYIFIRKGLFFSKPNELLNSLLRFGLAVSLSFLLLGVLDYFFAFYFWKKAMKMTKDEIKEERKQSEGDSQIKEKMRKRK